VLRCETEVLEVKPSRSRPEMGSVRTQFTTFNQHGEPVVRFIALALMARRRA
jgi:acyl dehydratase